MPTINYRINKIEGLRTGEESKSVDINSNFAILSVKKDNNPSIGDFLNIDFSFEVGYEPNLGRMKIEGTLWYSEKDIDKTVTVKGDKIKLDPETIKAVTTSIVRESLLEVIDLSKKLRLPVPIRLPSVDMKPTNLEFTKSA